MTCKGKYHDENALRTVTYSDGRTVQICKKCKCTVEDPNEKRMKLENPFKDGLFYFDGRKKSLVKQ